MKALNNNNYDYDSDNHMILVQSISVIWGCDIEFVRVLRD